MGRVFSRDRFSRISSLPAPFIAAFFGFLSSLGIARAYGADGRGEYAIAIAIIMAVSQFTSFGLGEALAVKLARNEGPSHPRMWLIRVWLLLIGVALIVFALDPDLYPIIIGVVSTSAYLHVSGFALTTGAMKSWAVAQIVQPISVLLAVLAFTYYDQELVWVLLTYSLSPIVAVLVCLRLVPVEVSMSIAAGKATRTILLWGMQRQLSLALIIVLRRVDILSLGIFFERDVIGRYAVAASIADLVLMPPRVLSGIFIRDEVAGRERSRGRVITVSLMLVLPVAVASVLSGWYIIPALWGQDFSDSYVYLLALTPSVLALAVARGLSSWRAGRSEQAVIAKRYLAVAVPGTLLIAALGYGYGIYGVTLANFIVFGALSIAGYIPVNSRSQVQ